MQSAEFEGRHIFNKVPESDFEQIDAFCVNSLKFDDCSVAFCYVAQCRLMTFYLTGQIGTAQRFLSL